MQTPTAESFSDMVKRYAFSAGDTLTDDEKRQAFMNAILGGQREFAFLDGRLALAAEGYGLRTWEARQRNRRDFLLSIEARFDGWCDG